MVTALDISLQTVFMNPVESPRKICCRSQYEGQTKIQLVFFCTDTLKCIILILNFKAETACESESGLYTVCTHKENDIRLPLCTERTA